MEIIITEMEIIITTYLSTYDLVVLNPKPIDKAPEPNGLPK